MDEETIRKRCIELTAGWLLDQGLVGLVHSVYRAAYADGLEKAEGLTNDMIDSIGRNLNSRCDNGCGAVARELICQALAQGPLTPGEE